MKLGLAFVNGGTSGESAAAAQKNLPPSFTNSKSLNFDGTNDYAEFATDSVLPGLIGSSDFAISYWVKAADFSLPGSGINNFFVYSLLFAGGPFNYFILGGIYGSGASHAGKMLFQISAGSTNYVTSKTDTAVSMTDNDWNHVVFSSKKSSGSRSGNIYVNGSLVASTVSSSTASTFANQSFGDIRMGSTTINISSDTYQAFEIDELSVYDGVLSDSDVTAIYNSGVPVDESSRSNLVGYWRMEDNGDDSSTNNNALTISGATFTTDVPS